MFERFRRRFRPVAGSVDRVSFANLTDRARRVLVLSQDEARLLDHNFIGTEHILLGLIREGENVAAKALESFGISLEAVREKVEETIGPAGTSTNGSRPFTPRAKKVLDLSCREARQLGHRYVGTEHMLLGLVREGEGIGAQVLISLGGDLSRVRQRVLQMLSGYESAHEGELTSDVANGQVRCSFCGKEQESVRKVIAGPGVYICDECVTACRDIIVEELGSIEPLPPPSAHARVSEGLQALAQQAEQIARHAKRLATLLGAESDDPAEREQPDS